MRPTDNYVLCTADTDQKSRHIVPGTDKILYLATQYNENKREANPNYATVKYIPDAKSFKDYDGYRTFPQILKPGDLICVQHFQIIDNSGNDLSIINDPETGERLYLIDLKEIYFKVENGEPVLLSNYLLCEQKPEEKYEEPKFGLILKDKDKKKTNQAKVSYISDSVRVIEVGDLVAFLEYSDYELELNGKKYLKMKDDEIFGILIGSDNE